MATQTTRIAVVETGLHLTAQVSTVDGTPFAADVAVTEVGSGIYTLLLTNSSGKYRIALTDDDDSDALLAVLYVATTNTTATFDAVSERVLLEISEDAATAAAGGGGGGGGGEVTGLSPAALAQIAGVTIHLGTQQQTDNGVLTIVQGADYSEDDGTAITWTLTDTADLTGATVTLSLKNGTTSQTYTGTVTEAAANTWTITIELTAAQTAALTASVNGWSYGLTLTLTNTHVRVVRLPGHRVRVLSLA